MAEKDKNPKGFELSRRGFLKAATAAGAVGGAAMDWAVRVGPAGASVGDVESDAFHTTCPYCSAQCGQIVRVATEAAGDIAIGDVIDIYGDSDSPINGGGLCAKGAGAFQLVNNKRRIGAWTDPDPDINPVFTADGSGGVAYKRTGNGNWSSMSLDTAMGEIASGMVSARGTLHASGGYNSKGVAFLGCSHMNNEANYVYRKMIANFGTSNTEHQARI